MNEIFHKIVSITMAFTVALSTMSFTVDMHYCGDTLVETAVFQKAKGCGMDMENPATEQCSITKKSCCTDEQHVIDGQDELQLSFDKLTLDQDQFIALFVYSYNNLFDVLEKKTTSFSEYPPPLIVRQLYKLDETYLI